MLRSRRVTIPLVLLTVIGLTLGLFGSAQHAVAVEGYTTYLPLVARPLPLPDVPALNAINNPSYASSYTVSWSVANHAETYILEEATNSGFSGAAIRYNGTDTTWNATGKGYGTYYYRVKARNSTGDGGWSQVRLTHVLPTVVYAAGDTDVLQGYPSLNDGSETTMLVGYDPDYWDPPARTVRSLVAFDLSVIPQGTPISQVVLGMYVGASYDYVGQSRTLTTYRITGTWTESAVTWNSKPGYGEAYGSVANVHGEFEWLAFDVTGLVRAWVNGTYPNRGIMVRGPESSNAGWRAFGTRETLTYVPYLQITYGAASAAGIETSEAPATSLEQEAVSGEMELRTEWPDGWDR